MRYLFIIFFSSLAFASPDWGDHWNNTGVTVTQPDVFNQTGVVVTDTLGRPSPQTLNERCQLIKQCQSNNQCHWMKYCP